MSGCNLETNELFLGFGHTENKFYKIVSIWLAYITLN